MDQTKVERPAFINSLLDEIESFDSSLFPPRRRPLIPDKDITLGPANEYEKKLFAYCLFYSMEERRLESITPTLSDEEMKETTIRISMIQDKYNFAQILLWWSVRDRFKCWEASGTGMRDNWMLIKRKDDPLSI